MRSLGVADTLVGCAAAARLRVVVREHAEEVVAHVRVRDVVVHNVEDPPVVAVDGAQRACGDGWVEETQKRGFQSERWR